MSNHTVTARLRSGRGKGPARRMRAEGRIPAVLYGGGKDPVSLSLDPNLLVKALDPALKRNTLLQLEVEDATDANSLVMVKDAQIDPLKDHILHVDLIRVDADQKVEVKVPLELYGRAVGVKLGGVLEQVYREIPVLAPAAAIPAKLEADITEWDLLHVFRAGDLTLPEGVDCLLDEKLKVATIATGRGADEDEEEGEEGEEGEGEEGEGGEGDGKASEGDSK